MTDGVPPPKRPVVGTRVGLSERSGADGTLPWRYAVPGDPNVSRPPLTSGLTAVETVVR